MRKWNKFNGNLTQFNFTRKQSNLKVAWEVYVKDFNNVILLRVDILNNIVEHFRYYNSVLYSISPEEFQQFTKVKLFNFTSAFSCLEQHIKDCVILNMKDLKSKKDNKSILVLAKDDYIRDLGLEPQRGSSPLSVHLEKVKDILKANRPNVKRSLYRKYLDDDFVDFNQPSIQRYQNYIIDGDFLYTKKDTFTLVSVQDIKVNNKVVAKKYKCENNIFVLAERNKHNNFVAKTLTLGSKVIKLEPRDRVFYLLEEKKVVS